MKRVIDTTDKKHIGDVVDETADEIVFQNGEVMQVAVRLHGNTVLANSNYIVVLSTSEV